MPIITSSFTSSPRSMVAFARRPMSVPAVTASRRISPVEIFGIPRVRANRSACVPLPAPGGPSINKCKDTLGSSAADPRFLHEAVVMPHVQLRLDLLHRVHRDADDDQERRAAEEELHVHAF